MGRLYTSGVGLSMGEPGEFPRLVPPEAHELAAARRLAAATTSPVGVRPALATTIGVVATDVALTKAQRAKVSGIAHDGMARGIRPVHTMFDGDTVFTMATGARQTADPLAFHQLLDAAGDCFTRAVGQAMLASESVETPAGRWRCYRDPFPSAFRAAYTESYQTHG